MTVEPSGSSASPEPDHAGDAISAATAPVRVDLRTFRQPPGYARGRSAVVVLLWRLIQGTVFRWLPHPCSGWRRFWLRCFGARIGRGVVIRPTVRVEFPWRLVIGDHAWIGEDVVLYSLDTITIGAHAVVSQRAYLATGSHDVSCPHFTLIVRPITIQDQAWLATDVFVAPGVTIGQGAVIAARSTVTKDQPPWQIAMGTPCRAVKPRAVRAPDQPTT